MSTEGPGQSPSPEREAIRIANAFESYDQTGRHWETAGDDESPFGQARVCRVWPARVLHVVGATEMAEQLRSLYGSGEITGWTLQPMAATRTPLHTVEQRIREAAGGTGRGYTPLARGGFVHTEEVQATPDAALLGVRNVGLSTLPIIREVLSYTGPAVDEAAELPPAARERLFAPERQAELDEVFTAATRARYRRLVDGLAASSIPAAALRKIGESLNAEALPPADSLVELLLETAGLDGLLQLYRDTHGPAE
ncbi:hypothetical protein [Amycolatopsis sp. lyj-23]|uniref:hypothetical protein n=1 Tax=Amycolatopsis sp. lyj-23 TaxID=2789283 RepID=UPI0039796E26